MQIDVNVRTDLEDIIEQLRESHINFLLVLISQTNKFNFAEYAQDGDLIDEVWARDLADEIIDCSSAMHPEDVNDIFEQAVDIKKLIMEGDTQTALQKIDLLLPEKFRYQ